MSCKHLRQSRSHRLQQIWATYKILSIYCKRILQRYVHLRISNLRTNGNRGTLTTSKKLIFDFWQKYYWQCFYMDLNNLSGIVQLNKTLRVMSWLLCAVSYWRRNEETWTKMHCELTAFRIRTSIKSRFLMSLTPCVYLCKRGASTSLWKKIGFYRKDACNARCKLLLISGQKHSAKTLQFNNYKIGRNMCLVKHRK